MEGYKPKRGDINICRACGRKIFFTGKYWEHEGETLRHIPEPKPPKNHSLDLKDVKDLWKSGESMINHDHH